MVEGVEGRIREKFHAEREKRSLGETQKNSGKCLAERVCGFGTPIIITRPRASTSASLLSGAIPITRNSPVKMAFIEPEHESDVEGHDNDESLSVSICTRLRT